MTYVASGTTAGASNTGSISPTKSGVTATNLLVLTLFWWSTTQSAVPTPTNWKLGYSSIGHGSAGGGYSGSAVFFADNAAAGSSPAAVCSLPNATSYAYATISEFSGYGTTVVVNVLALNAGGTNANTGSVGPTATTTQATALSIGVLSEDDGGTAALGVTLPTGYSSIFVNNETTTTIAGRMCFKELTATGTETTAYSWTPGAPAGSTASVLWDASLVILAAASSVGVTESSAGTTAQDSSMSVPTMAAAETTAGTTSQDAAASFTAGNVGESAAGTTAQDSSITLTGGAAETTASTTAQDTTIAAVGSVSESAAGTTAQDASVTMPSFGVTETSAGTSAQDSSVALTAGTTESSAGTTAQDQAGQQSFAVAESAAGTTAQDATIGGISTGVTETTAGTTTQGATVTPPQGNGASAVRRWLIQYYTEFQEKRKKDQAIKELSKEVAQASAGVITPKMTQERAPTPVVIRTPDAEAKARQAQQFRDARRVQASLDALLESQKALAEMPSLRVDDLHLQIEQGEEEDLLLLSSIL